jgi:predicted nicotinamide N-methyase
MLDLDPCALQCAALSAAANGLPAPPPSQIPCPAEPMSVGGGQHNKVDVFQRSLEAEARRRSQAAAGAPPQRDVSSTEANSAVEEPVASLAASARQGGVQAAAGDGAPIDAAAQASNALHQGEKSGHGRAAGAGGQSHSTWPGPCPVHAAHFDWSQPYDGGTFDVVVACDVLYEETAAAPLARIIPQMMGGGGSEKRLLLTDVPKRSPKHRRNFMTLLEQADTRLAVEVNRVVTEAEAGLEHDIQLVVLRQREGGDSVGLPLSSVL